MIRTLKIYLKKFLLPLLLVAVAGISWFILPTTLDSYKSGLIASILGIGISISVAEAIKSLGEHRRIKRTLGFMKLIVLPYLTNLSENIDLLLERYGDICTHEQASAMLFEVANFDVISGSFDKEWLQMVYAPEFIDAIQTDDQFNNIALAIYETLLITKALTWHCVQSRSLMSKPADKERPERDTELFIGVARSIRASLRSDNRKFARQLDRLDTEVTRLMSSTGATLTMQDR